MILPCRVPHAEHDPDLEAAALEIARVETMLARDGRTILDLLTDSFAPGARYPDGEIWDDVTHAQYFYHAHPEGGRAADEHGHFHTFLGAAGMPRGITPLILPEMALGPGCGGDGRGVGTHRSSRNRGVVSHLIGLTLDPFGRPIELFTTNRWVTGETWYRADDVERMLPCFGFAETGPASPISRWLGAVLSLLRPQIVRLLVERDEAVMDWRRRRSRTVHVFDDRRLEIPSTCTVEFAAELTKALAFYPSFSDF
jgi:hypothetical protein